jgi:hypothetical protein
MDDSAENNESILIPQPGGRGALRSGGKPGNSGGKKGRSGRLKERTKRRMLKLAGRTLSQIERDLDLLEASNGESGLLANQTPGGPRHGPMTRPDAIKLLLALAKHGVGTEVKKEIEETTTRYIIRYPTRAVAASPLKQIATAEDAQSTAARGMKHLTGQSTGQMTPDGEE